MLLLGYTFNYYHFQNYFAILHVVVLIDNIDYCDAWIRNTVIVLAGKDLPEVGRMVSPVSTNR